MKASRNWKTVAGWVLHGLVAGLMLLAGSAKLLGLFPPEQVEKFGLSVPIQVIGAGELVSAILLLVPRTASLGVLLTSAFWGGAICLHMSKGEPFVLQSVLLLLTWVGAYLRVPGTFASFAVSSLRERPITDATKSLVAGRALGAGPS
jgi:DoxX-like family